jgi:hypothetical protein
VGAERPDKLHQSWNQHYHQDWSQQRQDRPRGAVMSLHLVDDESAEPQKILDGHGSRLRHAAMGDRMAHDQSAER